MTWMHGGSSSSSASTSLKSASSKCRSPRGPLRLLPPCRCAAAHSPAVTLRHTECSVRARETSVGKRVTQDHHCAGDGNSGARRQGFSQPVRPSRRR